MHKVSNTHTQNTHSLNSSVERLPGFHAPTHLVVWFQAKNLTAILDQTA